MVSTVFQQKKYLGQNFIYDKDFLSSLIKDIKLDKLVIEIGMGKGTLTEVLSRRAKKVITFEIDKTLKPALPPNVEIIYGDALENDFTRFDDFIVVANLPYYITTPLIIKFMRLKHCRALYLMVQKEVAERIVSRPNAKSYGALSVLCQTMGKTEILRHVPRDKFSPPPKVDSAFISIIKNEVEFDISLGKVLKDAFSKRRKKLSNIFSKEVLEESGINGNLRPENLSSTDFLKIRHALCGKISM
ncbi:MAG: 16S rRNA (adenine(1518)-N(6)/adenine(1519)-N(6))-dimethyltransferase RsmA [Christensenellaceae bacterium]|jgi:16S rRNA (adenine1518-N6/adenine1519-N6)-dimethyltransferase|nr:16S rRNA (adenine(1518)-N(6)/adenine(1519)-N(6))-dimethyltransferase RsmA [Christensenellaceae bacterium]